jgi:hypothetical protein
MPSRTHRFADSCESFEVGLLGRDQWERSEMRQHLGHQISDVSHFELQRLVRSVRPDKSALPNSLDHIEQLSSFGVLADRETRSHLPSEAMAIAWLERNAETTFAIYESRNVGIQIDRQRPGPASYEVVRLHPRALSPRVVTGIRIASDLTLGITRDVPADIVWAPPI